MGIKSTCTSMAQSYIFVQHESLALVGIDDRIKRELFTPECFLIAVPFLLELACSYAPVLDNSQQSVSLENLTVTYTCDYGYVFPSGDKQNTFACDCDTWSNMTQCQGICKQIYINITSPNHYQLCSTVSANLMPWRRRLSFVRPCLEAFRKTVLLITAEFCGKVAAPPNTFFLRL